MSFGLGCSSGGDNCYPAPHSRLVGFRQSATPSRLKIVSERTSIYPYIDIERTSRRSRRAAPAYQKFGRVEQEWGWSNEYLRLASAAAEVLPARPFEAVQVGSPWDRAH